MTADPSAGRHVCGRCRHPRPLHSNGASACRAKGCHAGPDGTACQSFLGEAGEEAAVPVIPAVAFRAPTEAAG